MPHSLQEVKFVRKLCNSFCNIQNVRNWTTLVRCLADPGMLLLVCTRAIYLRVNQAERETDHLHEYRELKCVEIDVQPFNAPRF
jgi:hypothetical protein